MIKDMPHTCGLRTTLRAVENGKALNVYLAEDADVFVRRRVQEVCQAAGVAYEYVSDMKKLGEECGVQVKAACAAIIRE